jgi:hypothetical protein
VKNIVIRLFKDEKLTVVSLSRPIYTYANWILTAWVLDSVKPTQGNAQVTVDAISKTKRQTSESCMMQNAYALERQMIVLSQMDSHALKTVSMTERTPQHHVLNHFIEKYYGNVLLECLIGMSYWNVLLECLIGMSHADAKIV